MHTIPHELHFERPNVFALLPEETIDLTGNHDYSCLFWGGGPSHGYWTSLSFLHVVRQSHQVTHIAKDTVIH